MSKLWVCTRKGLFALEQEGRDVRVVSSAFEGVAVTMVLPDPRDGSVYAAVHRCRSTSPIHSPALNRDCNTSAAPCDSVAGRALHAP